MITFTDQEQNEILNRANKIIPYTKPSPMKVTFVGDTYSGKSTVLWGLRACDGRSGISFAQVSNIYSILWNCYDIRLIFWDVSAGELYRATTGMFLRASECILLFYDATKMSSLRRALEWYDIALDTIPDFSNFVLVASKCDLVDDINDVIKEGAKWAREHRAKQVLVSGQNGTGLDDLLDTIAYSAVSRYTDVQLRKESDTHT